MTVKINPKGKRQHDYRTRARIVDCERYRLERLLGPPHGDGDGQTFSVEWYLVTDHGSAMISDYWAFNDNEYAVAASNSRSAVLVTQFLRDNGITAYMKEGAL